MGIDVILKKKDLLHFQYYQALILTTFSKEVLLKYLFNLDLPNV
jgi:hypothetical protein